MNLSSKYYSINDSGKNVIEINESKDIYIVDCNSTIDSTNFFEFFLNNKCVLNINYLCLNNGRKKIVNFNVDHKCNDTICNINIKCFSNKKASTIINVNNEAISNLEGCKINQDISGVIFDNESIIKVLPMFNIEKNKTQANHSVNIGKINDAYLFYLNTKGCKTNEAKSIILQSQIEAFVSNKIIHNKEEVLTEFNKIVGGSNLC